MKYQKNRISKKQNDIKMEYQKNGISKKNIKKIE